MARKSKEEDKWSQQEILRMALPLRLTEIFIRFWNFST